MATSPVSAARRREWGVAFSVSPGAIVLAAAIPILFLHVEYQPGLGASLGGTTANAYLSDVAVLAIVLAAAASGLRAGFGRLARARALWALLACFVVWLFVEVALGRAHLADYPTGKHAVTGLKFVEYMLLAPSAVLLVRRVRDLLLVLWSLTLWSCVATVVGVLQFGGVIGLGGDVVAGRRQESFLGEGDFAALSGIVLLAGLVALLLPRLRLGRRLSAVACVTGGLGVVLAGAMAGLLGILTASAALAAFLLGRREAGLRRLAAAGAIVAAVAGGTVAIRGNDLEAFAHFLGAPKQERSADIQSYSQRTLLAWIGLEIWRDRPLLGVGWQGSTEPAAFRPHLAAAHRRFPDIAPAAFPSAAPDRRYGVQDVWIQALADLGVVGLLLWAGSFATAAWLALRALLRHGLEHLRLVGLLGVALVGWLWTAQGLIAGIPLDALTWLAFGLAAAPAVEREPTPLGDSP